MMPISTGFQRAFVPARKRVAGPSSIRVLIWPNYRPFLLSFLRLKIQNLALVDEHPIICQSRRPIIMNRNPLKSHLVVLFAAIILLVTILGPISISLAGNKDKDKAKTYIIVFRDDVDVDSAVPDVAQAHGLKAKQKYRNAIH